MFKKVFGNEVYLKQLLEDIFEKKINKIEYLDKELKKENKNFSYGICDFVLNTENGMILLELQNKDLKNIEARIWMYLFKLYVEHWSDKDYKKIKPIEVFLILNYPYQGQKALKKFQSFEKELQETFGAYTNITIWNLTEAIKEKNTLNSKYALLFNLNHYSLQKGKKF